MSKVKRTNKALRWLKKKYPAPAFHAAYARMPAYQKSRHRERGCYCEAADNELGIYLTALAGKDDEKLNISGYVVGEYRKECGFLGKVIESAGRKERKVKGEEEPTLPFRKPKSKKAKPKAPAELDEQITMPSRREDAEKPKMAAKKEVEKEPDGLAEKDIYLKRQMMRALWALRDVLDKSHRTALGTQQVMEKILWKLEGKPGSPPEPADNGSGEQEAVIDPLGNARGVLAPLFQGSLRPNQEKTG